MRVQNLHQQHQVNGSDRGFLGLRGSVCSRIKNQSRSLLRKSKLILRRTKAHQPSRIFQQTAPVHSYLNLLPGACLNSNLCRRSQAPNRRCCGSKLSRCIRVLRQKRNPLRSTMLSPKGQGSMPAALVLRANSSHPKRVALEGLAAYFVISIT